MIVSATGLGSPRNDMPEWKPYRWRGQPMPVPEPAPRRKGSRTPGQRKERLEALARMRISDKNVGLDRLPYGVLTHEQAARELGVTKRTIIRDLRDLRRTAGAS